TVYTRPTKVLISKRDLPPSRLQVSTDSAYFRSWSIPPVLISTQKPTLPEQSLRSKQNPNHEPREVARTRPTQLRSRSQEEALPGPPLKGLGPGRISCLHARFPSVRPLHTAGELQVQTRLQVDEAAHEERGSEQDEREVGYSPRAEEAQSGASTGKWSHKERLTMVETYLDVLEASLEEFYQGQRRLLGVESS
ncbi:hypothetical protein GW17_00061080, partial [Ensete ventricosum]